MRFVHQQRSGLFDLNYDMIIKPFSKRINTYTILVFTISNL